MQASDQALPAEKTSTVQVIISVPRDTRPPYFVQDTYTMDIGEDQAINMNIITIQARDDNLKVRVVLSTVTRNRLSMDFIGYKIIINLLSIPTLFYESLRNLVERDNKLIIIYPMKFIDKLFLNDCGAIC